MYLEFELGNLKELSVPTQRLPIVVERSEFSGAEGTWETLNPEGTDLFYYVDEHVNLLSFYRSIFYRCYVVINGKRTYSSVSTVQRELNKREFLIRRKILYDEELVLRKLIRNKIAIIKRKHLGNRCPECYDVNTGSVIKSNCKTCGGTGFLTSYYPPFITWGQRVPTTKEVTEVTDTPSSANEVDYTRLTILDYPTVAPQDVIVELDSNDRYKVDRVEQTEIRREIVHQELTLSKLNRADQLYKMAIPNSLLGVNESI
jgi:hypothetical protein